MQSFLGSISAHRGQLNESIAELKLWSIMLPKKLEFELRLIEVENLSDAANRRSGKAQW